MSKALTNSLALLQEIKNQLACGDATDRSKERINTLLDKRPHSPVYAETRVLDKTNRHTDTIREPVAEYSSKGSIRTNNSRPTNNRLYDLLKELKQREQQEQEELERAVQGEFDRFFSRVLKRRQSGSPRKEAA